MQEQNAVDQSLFRIRRGYEKRRIGSGAEEQDHHRNKQHVLHEGYSSRRYSPKSHNVVKKTRSNTARKPMPLHWTYGARSRSAPVTSVLATRIGVSSGSSSSGRSNSRHRAWVEIPEGAVSPTAIPQLPRKKIRTN